VVIELLEEDAARLGFLLRDYYMNTRWRKGFGTRCLQAMEPALCALARMVLETEGAVLPVIFEVELDEWEIELEGYAFNLRMPSMRMAMVFHLDMHQSAPRTRRVFAVLPDELLANVVQKLQDQIPEWDLRELDPRFAGFRQPVHLNLQLCAAWPKSDEFRLEAKQLRARLDLPN